MRLRRPDKLNAILTSVFFNPIAMLYVGRPGWAAFYFLSTTTLGGLQFWRGDEPGWRPVIAGAILTLWIAGVVHVWRSTTRYPQEKTLQPWAGWRGILGAALLLGVCLGLIRAFSYEAFVNTSAGMLPTLELDTRMLVQKWGYGHYSAFGVDLYRGAIRAPIARGDIVALDNPRNAQESLVKRVIGLPGERIDMEGDHLFINGRPVNRSAIGLARENRNGLWHESFGQAEYDIVNWNDKPREFPQLENDPDCRHEATSLVCVVPAGKYFVLGDNRDNSYDSRVFGLVPSSHIVGKLVWNSK